MVLLKSSLCGIEPEAIIDSLAVYRIGKGPPIFLMPYPHASTLKSIAESELVTVLTNIGRSVLTFDPPGIFKSARKPNVNMQEMINCSNEVLDYFKISNPIDLVGHSMGSFCALVFTLEYPKRVNQLALIGGTSGWRAVRKWGIHKNWKWYKDKEYWQCLYWGTRIFLGVENLKIHKQLNNLLEYASYVNKSYAHMFEIYPDDHNKSAPIRTKWMTSLRKENIDYRDLLFKINVPVLICAGKHDPQTPLVMNHELQSGIKNSQLVIFDNSGHFPFIEEKEEFTDTLQYFFKN